MKIEIWLDKDCKLCKDGIKYFKKLHKQNKEVYMHYNIKTFSPIDSILLTPDFNSEGHLTHFHIGRLDKKTIIHLLREMEILEKEAKLLKKMRK